MATAVWLAEYQDAGLAYAPTPVSYITQGSLPTVHASCPGSRTNTSPAPTVTSVPSSERTVICPDTQMPVWRVMHDSVPAMGSTSVGCFKCASCSRWLLIHFSLRLVSATLVCGFLPMNDLLMVIKPASSSLVRWLDRFALVSFRVLHEHEVGVLRRGQDGKDCESAWARGSAGPGRARRQTDIQIRRRAEAARERAMVSRIPATMVAAPIGSHRTDARSAKPPTPGTG
jgi:hypothetical protein